MALDTSVFSNLQPFKAPDPLASYETLQRLKLGQLQQQDVAQQIQQRQEEAQKTQISNQKATQVAQTIHDHIAGGGQLDDDELVNKISGIDPNLGLTFKQKQQEIKASKAAVKKGEEETDIQRQNLVPSSEREFQAFYPSYLQANGLEKNAFNEMAARRVFPTLGKEGQIAQQNASARESNATAAIKELEAGNMPQTFDDAKKRLDAIAPPTDKDFAGINGQMTNLLKASAQNPAGYAEALKQAYGLADSVTKAKATVPFKLEVQNAAANQATGGALDLMGEQALNGTFTSRNPVLLAKAYARAAEMAKERGLSSTGVIMAQKAAKANTEALNTLTERAALIKTFTDTTNQHMNTLTDAMKNVTDLGAPVLNTPVRDLQSKFGGNEKVTAFRAALMPVQNELAKALNGSLGSSGLTDSARAEFQPVLNGGATAGQILSALKILKEDMRQQNAVYEANKADLLQKTAVGNQGAPAANTGNIIKYDAQGNRIP